MLLRVRLIGSGTPRDPYRVNLPTYEHIHGNVTHGYAIVIVRDEVHDLTEEDLKDVPYEETTEGRLYFLPDALLEKLHAHWDETKYQEHAGKFRVDQV